MNKMKARIIFNFKFLCSLKVISILSFISICYCCLFNSHVQWWLLAHIRFLLIELLPFWDWTHNGSKRCLLENPYFMEDKPPSLDYNFCWPCENTNGVLNAEKMLKKDVLNVLNVLKKPMILLNKSSDYPSITKESMNSLVYPTNWSPCYFDSNIPQKRFLSWFWQNSNNWFAQWQLCDRSSLKESRKFYKKPSFFPNNLSCMGPNWLFLSVNYNAKVHKTVSALEDWIWFIQLLGDGHVQLISPSECVGICFNLTFTLKQGDSVLIPLVIYDLQYKPSKDNFNAAIATECHTH